VTDSGGSEWRKEAVKTGGRIHNIAKKNAERDLLYVQPTVTVQIGLPPFHFPNPGRRSGGRARPTFKRALLRT